MNRNALEEQVHTVALLALVLDRKDLTVAELETYYGLQGLEDTQAQLLEDLERQVKALGRYEIDRMIDIRWLCTLAQIEVGAEIKAVVTSDAQWLEAL